MHSYNNKLGSKFFFIFNENMKKKPKFLKKKQYDEISLKKHYSHPTHIS